MKRMHSLLIGCFLVLLVSCNNDDGDLCDDVCSYRLTGGQESGAVPNNVQGTLNLTFNQFQPGAPFEDGVTGTFTVRGRELTVQIGDLECLTITNPVQTGTQEVTFLDTCRDSLRYAIVYSQLNRFLRMNIITTGDERIFVGEFLRE